MSGSDDNMACLISTGRPERKFRGAGDVMVHVEDSWFSDGCRVRRKLCAILRAFGRPFAMNDGRLAIVAECWWFLSD